MFGLRSLEQDAKRMEELRDVAIDPAKPYYIPTACRKCGSIHPSVRKAAHCGCHSRIPITPEQLSRILSLRASGSTYQYIASQTGVSRTRVFNLLKSHQNRKSSSKSSSASA